MPKHKDQHHFFVFGPSLEQIKTSIQQACAWMSTFLQYSIRLVRTKGCSTKGLTTYLRHARAARTECVHENRFWRAPPCTTSLPVHQDYVSSCYQEQESSVLCPCCWHGIGWFVWNYHEYLDEIDSIKFEGQRTSNSKLYLSTIELGVQWRIFCAMIRSDSF